MLDLIRSFFKQHGLLLNTAEIERLLFEERFLLLVDGLNELPTEVARQDLIVFRRENATTPMIFTTRDLGVGGDFGIAKKLEMQHLTESQMQDFVKKYLPPEQGERLLRQLGDRLREFGQTPLLLLMLCSLFANTGDVPPNLGLVFRQFAQDYDHQRLQDVLVTDESWRWWRLLLEYLALRMTQGSQPPELQVAIPRQDAEEVLTEFLRQENFDRPRDRTISWLRDLLNHHLIQLGAEDKIEFRHQLIQEYYTAESLLKQLPHLNNHKLKREYLNYLKWTEPLVLMLELVDDEVQAKRVVELALEVDLRLGARLSGAVKPEFQAKTVELVANKKIPQWLKVDLLEMTRSEAAISLLFQALKDERSDVRFRGAFTLGMIGNEAAVAPLIQALKDEHSDVRVWAANALGKIATPKLLPELFELLPTIGSILGNTISGIQEGCKYYNYTLTQPETLLKPQPNIPPVLPISISLMHILHLSDLHFGSPENAQLWYSQLAEDLRRELNYTHLDAVILSGDIANKSAPDEYAAAKLFLNKLITAFQLKSDRIVIVPGNHDLNWGLAKQAYILTDLQDYQGELKEGCYIPVSNDVIRVRDENKYKQRFANFSKFYQDIKGEPYPLEYDQQGILHHLPEQNLLVLGLNSAWQLDHHHKSRASIHSNALSKALEEIGENYTTFENCLKIAVWHHPLDSAFEDRITESNFLERLAVAGFRFFLHGHVHQAQKGFYEYDAERGLYRICAGTFGAPTSELPTATAWQYHLLKFEGDKLTIRSRKRQSETGAWESDPCWKQGKGKPASDHYEITL